jgi:hypothetical protein
MRAALHGVYRGNVYSGPDKDKAIARLKALYEREGLTPPWGAEKALCGLPLSFWKSAAGARREPLFIAKQGLGRQVITKSSGPGSAWPGGESRELSGGDAERPSGDELELVPRARAGDFRAQAMLMERAMKPTVLPTRY